MFMHSRSPSKVPSCTELSSWDSTEMIPEVLPCTTNLWNCSKWILVTRQQGTLGSTAAHPRLQQVTFPFQSQTVPGYSWITYVYLRGAPHAHSVTERPPQFKLCTTDQPEVTWVLPTTRCLISCIICHAHHYVSEVSPAQNQNSSKRNPEKEAWPKQISTSINLHTLGKDHGEKVS